MQTSSSQNRHLILITFILALLFTVFYVFQPIDQSIVTSSKEEQVVEVKQDINPAAIKKIKTICNNVDISWL